MTLGGANSCRGGWTVLIALVTLLVVPDVGSAMSPTAHWLGFTQQAPTSFRPGDGHDFYELVAVNDGGAATSEPITVTDTLPAGFVVEAVNAYAEISGINETENELMPCELGGTGDSTVVTCSTGSSVPVGRSLVVNINVEVPGGAEAGSSLTNVAEISGGGAEAASLRSVSRITEPAVAVPFGASLASAFTDTRGVDTQAGSHPFAFTTILGFNVAAINPNESCNRNTTPSCAVLNAQAKDVEVALPPGLVGNPTAVPYCTQAQFEQNGSYTCPPSSQVGSLYLYFYGSGTAVQYAPVYNIEPPPGQPGELGFSVSTSAHIPMFFKVRSEGDYGVTTDLANISQFDAVRMAILSIWGEPSDAAHDPQRLSIYENCGAASGGCSSGVALPKPYLRLPTSCPGGLLEMPLTGDSWQDPLAASFPVLANANVPGMTGCERLQFQPAIGVTVDTHQAGAPAAYDVRLNVPQNEAVGGLATPDVRDAEVTLPEGTVLSPSAANGLSDCKATQFRLRSKTKGDCPDASRIGTVKIVTPLLADPVTGSVYLGAPECSPCSPADAEGGRMVRVLLEAEAEGVIIKQAGYTRIDQDTGRLTTVFVDTPQLPFSELELQLEPGANAPLINPEACGSAVAHARLTPWSADMAADVESPAFQVEGCGAQRFSPAFEAGMTSTSRAGAYSGVSVTLGRRDGEQKLGRVSVTTPPGLLGVLKNVEQCPEAQANVGTCSAGSLIGSGSIVVGAGASPLSITGSRVYLTGPYADEPFGLSVVTPAVAGPFILAGNAENGTEVVRAAIAVDPHTGALTVTSDRLPQQLNGVPLDVRRIHIDVDRVGFTFNPTNCDVLSAVASVTSITGAVAGVSYPFQATGCRDLPFKPTFAATTQGHVSKRNGASLHVHVASAEGQANIAKVKVDLPIQLPSRTSTLQKACVDSVFETNPAACSSESVVGHATAVTPLLKNPLTGPAYVVSHAGRSFPDLDIVLQGEGITLILTGNTDIKKGITSSTFNAVPDAPVSTFDLMLPEGSHSILAAFGSLCTGKLNMPTVITGQNGAVTKQTTKIAATGCPKQKKAKAKHAAKKKH